MKDTHWDGHAIDLARSAGGVLAFANPWDGVVRGGVEPWPPPELVQKLYESRQARAYRDTDLATATGALGYYSDIQSVHSEDAVTWSLFGPLAYESGEVRVRFVSELLTTVGVTETPSSAHIWLWRRIPHPDNRVPGGPEIDVGIQTARTLILIEAKWRSAVGAAQGVNHAKDQVQLRVEFCEKYGALIYPEVERFIVLMLDRGGKGLSDGQRDLGTQVVQLADASWYQLGGLASNPWRDEFLAQLKWRESRTRAS